MRSFWTLAVCCLALAQQTARIVIDYPQEGSIFPPDFASPTFLWRESPEEGNDSPAILIENCTAANRAVNIPEFVNIALPAAEFFRLFDSAWSLPEKGRFNESIAQWKLAAAYAQSGRFADAVEAGNRAERLAAQQGQRDLSAEIHATVSLYARNGAYRDGRD
jgi:hypothetical protein